MSKRAFSLVLATVFLTACPQPPDDAGPNGPGANGPGGPQAQGEGMPPQGGDGVAPPPSGDGAPAADGTAPPPAGEPGAALEGGAVGAPINLPSAFDELDEGVETVTISGTISGGDSVQIDLTRIIEGEDGDKRPEVVHVIKTEDGSFSLEIPADYESELYLFAFENPEGTGPAPDMKAALHPTPVKASGGDTTIDLTVSADFNPEQDIPWFDLQAPEQPPAPEGGPTPPKPGEAPVVPAGAQGDAAPADGAAAPAEGEAAATE